MTSTSECDACRRAIGLGQAAFTSECAHTFHLRCVSRTAACPVCAARWADAPAAVPTTTTTPSSSNPPPPLPAAHNHHHSSSALPLFLFGQPPPKPKHAPAASLPLCPSCHAAMRRGQATVTAECGHAWHLRCVASHYWARGLCPVCGARWRDCVALAPPSPVAMSLSLGGVHHPQPPPPSPQAADGAVEGPGVARDRDLARESFAVLVQILDRRRQAAAAGDDRCAELVAELRELSARVANLLAGNGNGNGKMA